MLPQTVIDELAECPIKSRGYQVPTALLLFLRNYFSGSHEKWFPHLNSLTYYGPDSPDKLNQTQNAIEIMRLGEERSNVTDLPKLVLRREAAVDVSKGIRDGRTGVGGVQETYETVTTSSTVIFALSRELGESESLGWEVFELMRHFRSNLRLQLDLKRFNASQIGSVGKLREFPNFLVHPVVVDYAYVDVVQLKGNKFPFREVQLRIK